MKYESPDMEIILFELEAVQTIIETSAGYGEGEEFPTTSSAQTW